MKQLSFKLDNISFPDTPCPSYSSVQFKLSISPDLRFAVEIRRCCPKISPNNLVPFNSFILSNFDKPSALAVI